MCDEGSPGRVVQFIPALPRSFWSTQEDVFRENIAYTQNAVLPYERSGYVGPQATRRTIEFKRLECPLGDLEKPFISRLIKFVIGCLNARVNGTIYFGVGDALNENTHGIIFGLHFTVDDFHRIQEIMEVNVTGVAPRSLKGLPGCMIRAVQKCVMGPILVPVEGSKKMVIECDVRPMSEYCAKLVFWCPTSEFIISRSGQPNRSGRRKVPYLRICTSTQKHRTEEKKMIKALEAEVEQNAKRLEVEEVDLGNGRYKRLFNNLMAVGKWLSIAVLLFIAITSSINFWMPILLQIFECILKTTIIAIYTILLPNIMPLNQAIECGDDQTLKTILNISETEVNFSINDTYFHEPPILRAVLLNNIIAVQQLLERPDIDVNIKRGGDGATAASLAAILGYVPILKLLMKHPGLQVNTQDDSGRTALFHAAQRGKTEVVRELLGFDNTLVNTYDQETSTTPLMIAIINGFNDVVKLLLRHRNIDINEISKGIVQVKLGESSSQNQVHTYIGASTLSVAASFGNSVAVKLLLENHKIKVNSKGILPLSAAASQGHVEVVKLLLANPEVDPNAFLNPCRDTALMMAARGGHHEVVSELLKDERTLVNIELEEEVEFSPDWTELIVIHQGSTNYYTPLSVASQKGRLKVVKELLDSSTLSVSHGEGLKALEEAADNGHPRVVSFLLRKFDIHVKGKT